MHSSGSGQWTWYRSMQSTCKRRRLASHSCTHTLASDPSDDVAVGLNDATALGGHVRSLCRGDLLQGPRDQFFGSSVAIDRGRVDPVDASLDTVPNRFNRFLLVLVAPAKFPIASANRPGADAEGRKFQVRVAKSTFVQRRMSPFRLTSCQCGPGQRPRRRHRIRLLSARPTGIRPRGPDSRCRFSWTQVTTSSRSARLPRPCRRSGAWPSAPGILRRTSPLDESPAGPRPYGHCAKRLGRRRCGRSRIRRSVRCRMTSHAAVPNPLRRLARPTSAQWRTAASGSWLA